MVLDGTVSVTTDVAGTLRKISPLKPLVDVTAGVLTGTLGTTSRLIGKRVTKPPEVIFLYKRQIDVYNESPMYMDAVKTVISLALVIVILHSPDVNGDRPRDLNATPVLAGLVPKLKEIGAHELDIDYIIRVLGCNGNRDLPEEVVPTVRTVNGFFLRFRIHNLIR